MAEFEAGLFDFDGTLVKSSFNDLLMIRSLQMIGQERSKNILKEAAVLPWSGCIKYLFPGSSQELTNKFNYEVTPWHYQLIDELEVSPGVLEILKFHRENKLPAGIVSNRSQSIYWMLRKKGLLDYCDVVVDISMVKNPKPDPEPMLLAAKLLGVDIRKTFVVGDSKADILSARGS